jgi:hypothetical protein
MNAKATAAPWWPPCYLQPQERSAVADVAAIPRPLVARQAASDNCHSGGRGLCAYPRRSQPSPRVRISDHRSTEAAINTADFQSIWAARCLTNARELATAGQVCRSRARIGRRKMSANAAAIGARHAQAVIASAWVGRWPAKAEKKIVRSWTPHRGSPRRCNPSTALQRNSLASRSRRGKRPLRPSARFPVDEP